MPGYEKLIDFLNKKSGNLKAKIAEIVEIILENDRFQELISNERFFFQKLADLINRILIPITMAVVLFLGYGLYSLVIVNAIIGLIIIGIKLHYLLKNKLIAINFNVKR